MKPTLVILAAGIGKRFGSLKQLEKMGPGGETIIDYSVFDAIRSGFGKVVFVIRNSFAEEFRDTFNERHFNNGIEVRYVFQELDCLPAGFCAPPGRDKPWGTNHAVLAAAPEVQTPFAAINADDFYGKDAFAVMSRHLSSVENMTGRYAMVGYELRNTLSEHGAVSRGVCGIDNEGKLATVVERTHIERGYGHIFCIDEAERKMTLAPETIVSMNFWGFTPDYFAHSEKLFIDFLKTEHDVLKAEFFIPKVVNALVETGEASVTVLRSSAQWFGVTYREDRERVIQSLEALARSGDYPERLW
jgi:NDP-sugar pyrophosphorylase family protein